MYFLKVHLRPDSARAGSVFWVWSLIHWFISTATIMDDLTLLSAFRTVGDLIHLGLSISLMWGLKLVSSPSNSDHFSLSTPQSVGSQSSSPRGTLLTTRLTVGVLAMMLKP